jgi:rhodanese-related sulfurtransferase
MLSCFRFHRKARPAMIATREGGPMLEIGAAGLHVLTGGIDAWSTEIDPRVPRY